MNNNGKNPKLGRKCNKSKITGYINEIDNAEKELDKGNFDEALDAYDISFNELMDYVESFHPSEESQNEIIDFLLTKYNIAEIADEMFGEEEEDSRSTRRDGEEHDGAEEE